MARSNARSQKAPRAPRAEHRQSQRSHRPRDPVHEDDQDDGEDVDMDEDQDGDGEEGDGDQALKRATHALVRLALFNEHKRLPLRRDEISKKGCDCFAAAATGTKTFIVRSVLNQRLLDQASIVHEDILEEEAVDGPSDDEEDDSGSRSGTIISWAQADQVGPLGILYTILSLVLVNGRVVGDQDLRTQLRRLGLTAGGKIRFSALSTHREMTLDEYLTLIVRQGYLERIQVGETGKKSKGKRGRVTQDEESGQAYEWRWGPRAHGEVGEKAIAAFVARVMVQGPASAEDEDEDGPSPQQANKLEKMVKGVERAAGGNLADVS
ncbi:unnamed protein product [Mycena citricolor]|uniref:MAGE domain-containing protein n=1 Tax=Mycena citricolor TaxID=2018698 RepID=A0AAD2K0J3_9AGAR|nr:unnamed protein product [Mycena citricolor]